MRRAEDWVTSIWPDFGFRVSPYATTPIPATAEGEQLLVGRDTELRRLKLMLGSSVLHPTVEGDNGAGKTSLVAVAGFQLFKEFKYGRTAQALIPPAQKLSAESGRQSSRGPSARAAGGGAGHDRSLRRSQGSRRRYT